MTHEEIAAFDRDGAVLIRGALPPEWVDVAAAGLDEAIAEPDALSPDPVPRHLRLEVVRGSHHWNATYSPLAGRDPRDDPDARARLEAADATCATSTGAAR